MSADDALYVSPASWQPTGDAITPIPGTTSCHRLIPVESLVNYVDTVVASHLPCPEAMVIHAIREEVTGMLIFPNTDLDMSIDAFCRITGVNA